MTDTPYFPTNVTHAMGRMRVTGKASCGSIPKPARRADLGGHFAIIPGELAKSELVRRVTAGDRARRMPPVYAPSTLTSADRPTQWIAQGAESQKHRSFIPPRLPDLPQVHDRHWPRNPIDHFVVERLEHEGMRPSPEADARCTPAASRVARTRQPEASRHGWPAVAASLHSAPARARR